MAQCNSPKWYVADKANSPSVSLGSARNKRSSPTSSRWRSNTPCGRSSQTRPLRVPPAPATPYRAPWRNVSPARSGPAAAVPSLTPASAPRSPVQFSQKGFCVLSFNLTSTFTDVHKMATLNFNCSDYLPLRSDFRQGDWSVLWGIVLHSALQHYAVPWSTVHHRSYIPNLPVAKVDFLNTSFASIKYVKKSIEYSNKQKTDCNIRPNIPILHALTTLFKHRKSILMHAHTQIQREKKITKCEKKQR